jgi:hypothetical protein
VLEEYVARSATLADMMGVVRLWPNYRSAVFAVCAVCAVLDLEGDVCWTTVEAYTHSRTCQPLLKQGQCQAMAQLQMRCVQCLQCWECSTLSVMCAADFRGRNRQPLLA